MNFPCLPARRRVSSALPVSVALGAALLGPSALAGQVTLGAGEHAQLGRQHLYVVSVQDSRCPAGTQCVWAGEVRARVLAVQPGRWTWQTLGSRATRGPSQASGAAAPALHITAVQGSGRDVRVTLSDGQE